MCDAVLTTEIHHVLSIAAPPFQRPPLPRQLCRPARLGPASWHRAHLVCTM